MKIQITRMERAFHHEEKSEIVAIFDAKVGDFHVRRAALRRNLESGAFFVGFGGGVKKRTGITLPMGSETRNAIEAAAVWEFECLKHL